MKAVQDLSREIPAWIHAIALLFFVTLLGLFFANVEVEIEGCAGWASALPTWRIENHPLLDIFWAGKALTGYHAWIFAFMALIFHLPVMLVGKFTWRLEARIVGSLMLFWIIEDFAWFMFNPAFGLSRFSPEYVPWHKSWVLWVPIDYIVTLAIGMVLYIVSFSQPRVSPENEVKK